LNARGARIALSLYLALIYSTLGVVRSVSNFLRDRGVLRFTVFAAFMLAACALVVLVFHDRRNRSWRVIVALAIAFITYAALVVPMQMPEEKIHFIEYGVVAMLARLSTPERWSEGRRFAVSFLFVVAAGWMDEIIQGILPNRVYDLRDVGFNAAAGLIALILIASIRAITRSRRDVPLPSPAALAKK
jgi:VanZ family protein